MSKECDDTIHALEVSYIVRFPLLPGIIVAGESQQAVLHFFSFRISGGVGF